MLIRFNGHRSLYPSLERLRVSSASGTFAEPLSAPGQEVAALCKGKEAHGGPVMNQKIGWFSYCSCNDLAAQTRYYLRVSTAPKNEFLA